MKKLLSLALAVMLCLSLAVPAFAASPDQVAAADRLYSLKLFKGVGSTPDGTPDYALDRSLTRAEAVTMLVRLMGKENEAKAGAWETPFTDVPAWAAPYVGYAYDKKYTNGISKTAFGSSSNVSTTQYLTFILRALGYTSGTDFAWDSAWTLTDQLGITSGEYNAQSDFLRRDAVLVSSHALDTNLKGEGITLLTAIQAENAAAPTDPTPSEPSGGQQTDSGKIPPDSIPGDLYILNISTMKFHRPGCRDIPKISAENRHDFTGNRETLIDYKYSPCGHCNP